MSKSLHTAPPVCNRTYKEVTEARVQRRRVDLHVPCCLCLLLSSIGRGLGRADPRDAAYAMLDHTAAPTPAVFVLGNAAGFVQRGPPVC